MTKTCPDGKAEVLSTSQPEFVLMPREATRAMTMAGCDSLPSCEHVFGHAGEMLRNAYRKMVDVAAHSSSQPNLMGTTVSEDYQRGYIDGVEWAMKPATPAVGGEREAMASISRAVYRIREWAKGEGPYSEFIKEAAIIEKRLEQIALAAQPASQPSAGGEAIAWRTKNEFGHWHITQNLSLAETWLKTENLEVQPLYAAQPASPLRGREITADELAKFIHNYDRFLATYIARNLLVHFSIYPKSELASTTFASPPEQPAADTADIRWAVNVLLEKIAEKFEGWDTFDLFRSEAAATVRSFKHNLADPAADPAMRITDEMVLAGAKAANPFAWEMDEHGEYLLEYSARQAMLDEIRLILTAALSPANKEIP